ncbi:MULTISPECIES: acyl-CoA-binding protein [Flavobacterium]|jgi:acyl-CoA-binding protein|uniref:Acyl-CoA-binding protein n=2 Tax=Flavobacterium johnsoniae TaxID=986 RepID=A0A1M7BAD2_FLAJO|nr:MULTISPECIES: acyl-CoA-binding protein [Flavobacterium]ABQ05623.1 acyl-coA-binding protein, ACBP [Flavobacterium johnsoniae UW101]OXG00104.1 phosphatidylserine decarboxylase [Flavobacterium johnsoniae UW101]WDF61322.1 acyl-CoA-binding protein [Flavobacterium sp. KACC 22758]WQG82574.1 acyl-CoA-binding protein [Flavobacterium johnsoniae UW101]SHH00150.1 Acyl-CoA-binding protein [Flavobacterium johnsoniae]
MADKDLDKRFSEAVEIAMNMTQASLPQDVQLRLYAFYKQATFGTAVYNQSENFDLRNAFKTNAWMQISHLSTDEAKENYIEIINSLTSK